MSTATVQAAPPQAAIQTTALVNELVRCGMVAEGQDAVVTEGELRDLLAGVMTRTESGRLQRRVLLELMGRGLSDREIRQRLRLSTATFVRLTRGILADGTGDDLVERMRVSEKARLDWTEARATQRYMETGKAEWLRIRNDCSDRRRHLFGLDMPVQVEITTTRRVALRLQVITSREQWEAIQATRQRAIDVEVLPRGEEVGDGTPSHADADSE